MSGPASNFSSPRQLSHFIAHTSTRGVYFGLSRRAGNLAMRSLGPPSGLPFVRGKAEERRSPRSPCSRRGFPEYELTTIPSGKVIDDIEAARSQGTHEG